MLPARLSRAGAGSAIGWDIGGAHLKAARVDAAGRLAVVVQEPCALWQGLSELDRAFLRAREKLGDAARHAFTMTGEMTDLFADRRQGVRALCDWIQGAVEADRARVFTLAHGLVPPNVAATCWRETASANWACAASWLTKHVDHAVFVDVGSTTTDIVPIAASRVAARGRTDHERLVAGELVYTGVVRTPIMALAREVDFRGRSVPLMAELFATMADVHRLTGDLVPAFDQAATADGRPRTRKASAARLARMIGADAGDASLAEWTVLARRFAEIQRESLRAAWERVAAAVPEVRDAPLVAAGAGAFLVRALANTVGRDVHHFSEFVPRASSRARLPLAIDVAAPAAAVGLLARQAPPVLTE